MVVEDGGSIITWQMDTSACVASFAPISRSVSAKWSSSTASEPLVLACFVRWCIVGPKALSGRCGTSA